MISVKQNAGLLFHKREKHESTFTSTMMFLKSFVNVQTELFEVIKL